jgi:hypothetical protein
MTRDALGLGYGAVAIVIALALTASWWAMLLAAALYVVSLFLGARGAAIALLAAPVVLALGIDVATVLSPRAGLAALVALLGAGSFFDRTGARVPWKGPVAVFSAVAVLGVALAWVPWAPSLVASDVATRAQVVLAAAIALVVLAALDRVIENRHA